ncbi:hypothetical protein ACP4OV_029372 [Aristida adscensionis]
MASPRENGRNLAHRDNQLGHVVRSFPSPALNRGQVTREASPLHANQAGAPLLHQGTNNYPGGTKPQGYDIDEDQLQHFSGSVRGKAIRAAVDLLDTLVSWPNQNHECTLGWRMVQQQQQQQQEVPPQTTQQARLPSVARYRAPVQVVAPNGHVVWGMPMAQPPDAPFLPRPMATAPLPNRGSAASHMMQAGAPPRANHFAQAQSHLAPVPDKSLEQFLKELGVLEDAPVDDVYNGGSEDVDLDALLFGPGEGGVGVSVAPAVSHVPLGPSLGQLSRAPVRSSPETSGGRSHRSAAAEAREQRIRRMAKKKEAAARARAKKLAATRGNLEGSNN